VDGGGESVPVVGGGGKAWGTTAFISYFLSVFIVRQLISSWAAWEMNYEVRQGTLAMRLLRPIHPLLSYCVGNLAALPLRAAVTLPVIVVLFATTARDHSHTTGAVAAVRLRDRRRVADHLLRQRGFIGALSLFMESSVKLMDVWLAAFFVFSGYLFPLDHLSPVVHARREVAAVSVPDRPACRVDATGALDVVGCAAAAA
jgi:ABC-2 type transport system permease protein